MMVREIADALFALVRFSAHRKIRLIFLIHNIKKWEAPVYFPAPVTRLFDP